MWFGRTISCGPSFQSDLSAFNTISLTDDCAALNFHCLSTVFLRFGHLYFSKVSPVYFSALVKWWQPIAQLQKKLRFYLLKPTWEEKIICKYLARMRKLLPFQPPFFFCEDQAERRGGEVPPLWTDSAFFHHQQGRIDFNTGNPSLSTGKDFLIHSL